MILKNALRQNESCLRGLYVVASPIIMHCFTILFFRQYFNISFCEHFRNAIVMKCGHSTYAESGFVFSFYVFCFG